MPLDMARDLQGGEGKVSMQVDVGVGVMMQAEAANVSTLLVDVGLGFRVECGIAEAQDIASLHVSTAEVRYTFALYFKRLPPMQPLIADL